MKFRLLDEKDRNAYWQLINILRVYENFHDYNYDEVYRLTEEILKSDMDPQDYFMPVYDLGYQFEIFYLNYYKEPRLIEYAVRLYEKSCRMIPAWSKAYTAYTWVSWGRSQYYAGKYEESIRTLKKGVEKIEYPLFYLFLSLNYYRLKDNAEGKYWEDKTRKAYKNNRNIINEFEEMLKEAKKN